MMTPNGHGREEFFLRKFPQPEEIFILIYTLDTLDHDYSSFLTHELGGGGGGG